MKFRTKLILIGLDRTKLRRANTRWNITMLRGFCQSLTFEWLVIGNWNLVTWWDSLNRHLEYRVDQILLVEISYSPVFEELVKKDKNKWAAVCPLHVTENTGSDQKCQGHRSFPPHLILLWQPYIPLLKQRTSNSILNCLKDSWPGSRTKIKFIVLNLFDQSMKHLY